MKHLKSLNYCKRMIKSTSAFGNASKGFASNELAQADKSVKDQAVKLSLMLVSGALVWTSGGVQEAQAQVCGDGGQYTFHNAGGVTTPICVGGSSGNRVYGTHPYDGYGPPPPVNNTAPPPVIQKPSSYGAVAENKKTGLIVGASKQASKQASINTALQKCGDTSCEVATWYANQCVAGGYGMLKGGYPWYVSLGLNQQKAEKNLLTNCGKKAKNCKISFSECSLP